MRARSLRGLAAICAVGALLGGAATSQARIRGSYSGAGNGFTISFQVQGGHVVGLNLSCGRGAITVAAVGAAPRVKSGLFTYSGPAHSTTRSRAIHMKVTGKFSDKGKKVKGTASTSGVCRTGIYTASKEATS